MARDYFNGLLIVIITIILTVLLWLFLRDQQSTLPVYVLVVDEFDTNVEVKPDELEGNCVVDPSGTAIGMTGVGTAIGMTGVGTAIGMTGVGTAIGMTGVGTSIPDVYFTMSHGAIVREVVEASYPEANIIEVDLDTYDTTHAAERIKETIRRKGRGYYIVNMSFSIVPCDFVETLEEYRKLFDDIDMDDLPSATAEIDKLENEFYTTIKGIYDDGSKIVEDPILDFIKLSCETKITVPEGQLPILELPREAIDTIEPPIIAAAVQEGIDISTDEKLSDIRELPTEEGFRIEPPVICSRTRNDGTPIGGERAGGIIFVAAAGNGSVSFTTTPHPNIEFPFAPAIWDDVISISASIVIGRDGEALEPVHPFSTFGYSLAPYSNYGALKMPTPYQGIGGTSFAAPRYSALLAMMLTPNQGNLGYTNFCLQQISPLPLPDSWENRTSNMNQPLC